VAVVFHEHGQVVQYDRDFERGRLSVLI
jgi:hypothetical protein